MRQAVADVASAGEVEAVLATIADGHAGIAPAQRLLSSKGVHGLDLFRRAIEVNSVGTFNMKRLAAAASAANDPDGRGTLGVIVDAGLHRGLRGAGGL